jgi:hypothetical protein
VIPALFAKAVAFIFSAAKIFGLVAMIIVDEQRPAMCLQWSLNIGILFCSITQEGARYLS